MTTAHRPTWNSAKGQANPGGIRTIPSTLISAKDNVSKLQLKRRNDNPLFQAKDVLKEQLKIKESFLDKQIKLKLKSSDQDSSNFNSITNKHNSEYNNYSNLELNEKDLSLNKISKKEFLDKNKYTNQINNEDESENEEAENTDKEEKDNDDSEENNEEEDEDYDEEKELMAEYQKILEEKKQLEREKQKKEAEKLIDRTDEEILSGNPLYVKDYSLKKKWYEDTTFRNQAKVEKPKEKRFVNDTIRSDFFRNFINENIQ